MARKRRDIKLSQGERDTRAWTKSIADEKAVAHGCYFDVAAGLHTVEFFETFLCHSTGALAGQAFTLIKWQRDELIMPLFGWKRADGSRRFRIAYIEIPKKNGKSTLSSGLGLYLLSADGEAGAQVFCAAFDRLQAGIVFKECAKMVNASPALRSRLRVIETQKTITFEALGSWLRALSADAYSNEGLNIHGLIFDELHTQKTRVLWDALRYGGAARRQPLIVSITTAGYDRHSVCWEQHEYAEKVLAGIIEDDSFFPFIRAASVEKGKEDDWKDPKVWHKANPSLGHTITLSSFKDDFNEAVQSPTKENAFKRYRLNIWTEQAMRWLQMDKWDLCGEPFDPAELEKQPCFAALDLSSTRDITALALFFPETCRLLLFFWIPEDNAQEREKRDRVPYMTWAREGHIKTTPGNVIDYSFIRKDLNDLKNVYDIKEVAYDPWNAQQLATQLAEEDGMSMVEFRQGFISMNEPTKYTEALVLKKALRHGGNPVLRWMASNVAVKTDPHNNIKIDKEHSNEKVDGMVASVMAIGRATQTGGQNPGSISFI